MIFLSKNNIHILLIYILLFIVIFCCNYWNNNQDSIIKYLKYKYYSDYSHILYLKFNKNKIFNVYENNSNIIYSLKTFYKKFKNFDYYSYRKYKSQQFFNMKEIDVILYWYDNDINCKYPKIKKEDQKKKIIFYPNVPLDMKTGGSVIQYYFSNILDKIGIQTRMVRNINSQISNKNTMFNVNYYNNDFDLNDCVVIYIDTQLGNPLNAPHIVRWVLLELHPILSYFYALSWNKNDLVYYFNSEIKFNEHPDRINTIYKLLYTLYINPLFKNLELTNRSGYCYTIRKNHAKKYIHPNDAFEITREHTQDDYQIIFNNYKFFISYDQISFLTIISTLCGCISIVCPIDGITKRQWLAKTSLEKYLIHKKIDNLYGIAYGNSPEELLYAEQTIHLVKDQWIDIKEYEKSIILDFIDDINNFDNNQNTVKNNFLN